jgi:hypothetical protein
VTLSLEDRFYFDLKFYIRVVEVKGTRAKDDPMLLIVFLKSFKVCTKVHSWSTPVGIKGLHFLAAIILTAVGVKRDLPIVKLLIESVFLNLIFEEWDLTISKVL